MPSSTPFGNGPTCVSLTHLRFTRALALSLCDIMRASGWKRLLDRQRLRLEIPLSSRFWLEDDLVDSERS